jgi:hypothetical protein
MWTNASRIPTIRMIIVPRRRRTIETTTGSFLIEEQDGCVAEDQQDAGRPAATSDERY